MAWANNKGRSWARIVATVLFALNTIWLIFEVGRASVSLIFDRAGVAGRPGRDHPALAPGDDAVHQFRPNALSAAGPAAALSRRRRIPAPRPGPLRPTAGRRRRRPWRGSCARRAAARPRRSRGRAHGSRPGRRRRRSGWPGRSAVRRPPPAPSAGSPSACSNCSTTLCTDDRPGRVQRGLPGQEHQAPARSRSTACAKPDGAASDGGFTRSMLTWHSLSAAARSALRRDTLMM